MIVRHVLISGLFVVLGTAVTCGADWPCYLNVNRDNTSADKNLKLWSADSPKVLWKKNVGEGHSCMTVAGERLYTQGAGAVWCLDAASGETVWRWPPAGKGKGGETTATPTIAGGLVVALNNDHTVVALDAAKGQLLWSKKTDDLGVKQGPWALSCSPLVLGDKVVMDLGVVFVLDKKTGDLVWKAGSETAGYASAKVFGRGREGLVTSFNGAGLAIYDMAKGKPVAKYPWETAHGVNAATPIVSGSQDLHLQRLRSRLLAPETRERQSHEGLGEQGVEQPLPDLRARGRISLRRTRPAGPEGQPQVPGVRDRGGPVGREGPAGRRGSDAGRRQALRHARRRHAAGGRGIAEGLPRTGPRQGPRRAVLDDAGCRQRARLLPKP